LNSFDLPDDVFEEGECKPVKATKKKKIVQKRSASKIEVCPFEPEKKQASHVRAGHLWSAASMWQS